MRALPCALLLVLAACGGDDGSGGPDAASIDAPAGCGDGVGAWRGAPPVGGGAIQETAAVAVDGRIFVLGGFTAAGGIVPSVQIYDPATCAWSQGPDLPTAVHHANAAVVDGTIYVVGALEGVTFRAIGEVWAWDPATDVAQWTPRASMPAGTERGSSIVGAIDGVIYVAGGLRGGAAVTDVSAYDPAEDAWSAAPALPAPRDHGCGGVVDGTLYVTGGRAGAIGSISAAVYAFTPGGAWTERAPMPTARGGTACGVIGGRIVVVGGEGNPDAASGVFPQAEVYAPAADTWATLEPMPVPRHGMGAAAWDGALYVPGGATRQGFGAVDTHEVLVLP